MEFVGQGSNKWLRQEGSTGWTPVPAMPAGWFRSTFSEAPDPGRVTQNAGPVLVMPPAKPPNRPRRWLQRLWLVVFVLFCLEVGIILTVLPWTRLWSDNSLLVPFPAVKEFLSQNFVRGLVTGLGLVNIWMGVVEAITYRESPRQ
jgi:hypothetical protein